MNIVLVEDDDGVKTFVERVLRDQGHDVTSFHTAEAALAHTRTSGGTDLLIADVALPGMTGVVLAHWMRAQHAALPVVLTSGYSQNRDFTEASQYGWQLLPKPFRREELASAIARALSSTLRRDSTSA